MTLDTPLTLGMALLLLGALALGFLLGALVDRVRRWGQCGDAAPPQDAPADDGPIGSPGSTGSIGPAGGGGWGPPGRR